MKRIGLLLFSLLMTVCVFPQNTNNPKLGTDKIEDVVSAMTLKEKVYLLVGMGNEARKKPADGSKSVMLGDAAGLTYAIPRLGITPTVLTDGPAGLRISVKQELADHPFYCTAFPTATALASTWNSALVEDVGKAMGNEVLEYGSDVLLAPAINNQRNPLGGRNFEYYSEDPLVAGKLSAAMIRGIQSNGVGTSLKHFAANNIETNRKSINEIISQRALREIYLRGFEIAVKEAQPWTVMSSYNQINGFFTSENRDLITTILRDEWGFKGMVMTDWWDGTDPIAQMNAGNDMLMPGNDQRELLINAVNNKLLNENVLNQNVTRALAFIMKTPRFKGYTPSYTPDLKAHAQVAQNAATEAMVLLKNDKNTLPFASNVKRIALFGKTSYHFIAGGTGSGEVNYEKAASIGEALESNGYKSVQSLSDIYKNFIDTLTANSTAKPRQKKTVVDFHPELALTQSQINDQVKNSDIAVITIGRNAGEGADRKVENFSLSQTEKDLIKNVSSA
jgi:beta-glucosidase